MSKTTVFLSATAVAGLALAGCSHTTTREIVTPAPTATAAPPTVIVATPNTPPPAPRIETRPPSPGHEFVWQNGYWTVANGQYQWVPGHWEAPVVD
jgi:PBP1b-binding outer membrane lipoprotein LpoB